MTHPDRWLHRAGPAATLVASVACGLGCSSAEDQDQIRDVPTSAEKDVTSLDTVSDDTRGREDTVSLDTRDDRVDTGPELCPFDCWPYVECVNGIVKSYSGGFYDLPCDTRFSCGVRGELACAEGCGVRTRCNSSGGQWCADAWGCHLAAWCAESQPVGLGKACAVDDDCRWTCALSDEPAHQRCAADQTPAVCVAADPPTGPADLGKPCDVDAATIDQAVGSGIGFGKFAFLKDHGECTTSLCVVGRTRECRYSACTLPCRGDFDCPAHWLCQSLRGFIGEWDGVLPVGCAPRSLDIPAAGDSYCH